MWNLQLLVVLILMFHYTKCSPENDIAAFINTSLLVKAEKPHLYSLPVTYVLMFLQDVVHRWHWRRIVILADSDWGHTAQSLCYLLTRDYIYANMVNLPIPMSLWDKTHELLMSSHIILLSNSANANVTLKQMFQRNLMATGTRFLLGFSPEDIQPLSVFGMDNTILIGEYKMKDQVFVVDEIYWNSVSVSLKRNPEAVWTFPNGLITSRKSLSKNRDFDGIVLKFAACLNSPYFFKTNEENTGYYLEIIKEISRILNFRYTFSLILKTCNYGKLNKTTKKWSGLVGALTEKIADMTVTPLNIDASRKSVIDSTIPLDVDTLTPVVKKTTRKLTLISYINIFTSDVWLLTVGVVLLVAFFLTFPNQQKHFKNLSSKYFRKVLVVLGAICQNNPAEHPSTSSGIIFFLSFVFTAKIIYSFYNSRMTSLITLAAEELPFSTLKEALDNVDYQFEMPRTGSAAQFVQASQSSVLQELWKRINKTTESGSSPEAAVSRLEQEKSIYVGTKMQTLVILMLKGKSCNYGFLPSLMDYNIAFAFQKNSPYRKLISLNLIRLKETGTLQRIQKKYFPIPRSCKTENVFFPIHLQQILSIFYLFAFITSTVVCVVLIKSLIAKVKMRKMANYKFF